MNLDIKILPSMLAADFGRFADEAKRAEAAGGDALHMDVMDGHFVPNLTMGPDLVAAVRRAVGIPLNVHLMMTRPDRMIEAFARAGAHTLLIHIEAQCDVAAELKRIRALGVRPGITLSPETDAAAIFPVLDLADEVLCMTVRPGYGGQSFMEEVLPKIFSVRQRAIEAGRPIDIMVDGGIDAGTAVRTARAGANFFVAGTYLFRSPDMAARIQAMRQGAREAFAAEWR